MPEPAALDLHVQRLIALVANDTALDVRVRDEAARLEPVAQTDAELALSRLETLSADWAHALERDQAQNDLCRAVDVEDFWEYYLDEDVKSFYPRATDYLERLQRVPQPPDPTLLADLQTNDPLFQQEHSWMVDCASISHMSGRELKRALGLRSDPPFIVFYLSVADMKASGVTVRPARAVDAVPSGFTEWSPDGLPTGLAEVVDGDVPRRALTRLEWRP